MSGRRLHCFYLPNETKMNLCQSRSLTGFFRASVWVTAHIVKSHQEDHSGADAIACYAPGKPFFIMPKSV